MGVLEGLSAHKLVILVGTLGLPVLDYLAVRYLLLTPPFFGQRFRAFKLLSIVRACGENFVVLWASKIIHLILIVGPITERIRQSPSFPKIILMAFFPLFVLYLGCLVPLNLWTENLSETLRFTNVVDITSNFVNFECCASCRRDNL